MLAENWCGDVHRNSPLIARIAEAMPGCELRVLFRDQNLDLTDCFLNNSYRSILAWELFNESHGTPEAQPARLGFYRDALREHRERNRQPF